MRARHIHAEAGRGLGLRQGLALQQHLVHVCGATTVTNEILGLRHEQGRDHARAASIVAACRGICPERSIISSELQASCAFFRCGCCVRVR